MLWFLQPLRAGQQAHPGCGPFDVVARTLSVISAAIASGDPMKSMGPSYRMAFSGISCSGAGCGVRTIVTPPASWMAASPRPVIQRTRQDNADEAAGGIAGDRSEEGVHRAIAVEVLRIG